MPLWALWASYICPKGPLWGKGMRVSWLCQGTLVTSWLCQELTSFSPTAEDKEALPKGASAYCTFRCCPIGASLLPKGDKARRRGLRYLLAKPIYARSAYCTFRCWTTLYMPFGAPLGHERIYILRIPQRGSASLPRRGLSDKKASRAKRRSSST